MSYGISLTEVYQQLGAFAGRSLKGAKLIDLPIVRSVSDISTILEGRVCAEVSPTARQRSCGKRHRTTMP